MSTSKPKSTGKPTIEMIAELDQRATATYECPVCTMPIGQPCVRKRTATKEGATPQPLKHPHPERVALVIEADRKAAEAAQRAGEPGTAQFTPEGAGDQSLPPDPVQVALAEVERMAAGGLQAGEITVPSESVDAVSDALNGVFSQPPLAAGWSYTTFAAGDSAHPGMHRFELRGPAPEGTRAGSGGGRRGRQPTGPQYTECGRCHYQYAAPWGQDHCNSDRACQARQDINALERQAGLEPTVWNQHGHALRSAMKAAREIAQAKIAEQAAAAAAPGDGQPPEGERQPEGAGATA